MVELDTLRTLLSSKPEAAEEFPFGPETLVFKVRGKIFAFVSWDQTPLPVALKCDPEYAEELRCMFPAIKPGYHLNKRHWNTVVLDDTIPDELVQELIDLSYALVVKGLPKAERDALTKS